MKTIQTLIKLHNASYFVQKNGNIILAGLIIWSVLIFVTMACPSLLTNILHDILTRR